MKIKGRSFTAPNTEILALPRPDGDVVFVAQGVLSFKEFDTICPEPEAPMITPPTNVGTPYRDLKDPKYVARIEQHLERRNNWFVLESLKTTPDLVWEKVDPKDPETWANWRTELEEACFTELEIARIQYLCNSVNSMSDIALEAARQRFIAGNTATSQPAQ